MTIKMLKLGLDFKYGVFTQELRLLGPEQFGDRADWY